MWRTDLEEEEGDECAEGGSSATDPGPHIHGQLNVCRLALPDRVEARSGGRGGAPLSPVDVRAEGLTTLPGFATGPHLEVTHGVGWGKDARLLDLVV